MPFWWSCWCGPSSVSVPCGGGEGTFHPSGSTGMYGVSMADVPVPSNPGDGPRAGVPSSAPAGEPMTPPVGLAALLGERGLGLRHLAGPAVAEVHGVHASEMADPSPYLLGGELLLTAGAELTEAGAAAYVGRLARAGAAALGFGVTPVHEVVPPGLAEACERYGLPLVEVPPGTPFTAVARSVGRLMAEARTRELRRVAEAQQALAAAAARPDPVPALLSRLAASLGGWAALLAPGADPAPDPAGAVGAAAGRPGKAESAGPAGPGAGPAPAAPGAAGPAGDAGRTRNSGTARATGAALGAAQDAASRRVSPRHPRHSRPAEAPGPSPPGAFRTRRCSGPWPRWCGGWGPGPRPPPPTRSARRAWPRTPSAAGGCWLWPPRGGPPGTTPSPPSPPYC
ncbi:predicted protein [Streptomyces sp. C]|nr:predicted protein [Streptomyces sp. C]